MINTVNIIVPLKNEENSSQEIISRTIKENNSNNEYIASTTLRAIKKELYKSSLGNKYTEFKNYILYKASKLEKKDIYKSSIDSLPVVLNIWTNYMGILTGNYIVHLEKNVNVDFILKKFNLSIFSHDNEKDIYILSSNGGENFKETISILKKGVGIKKVFLEILEATSKE